MATNTQIEQVKELASLFFTLEEISLLTLIDIEELRREVQFGRSALKQAYWEGKLEAKKEINSKLKTMAKGGLTGAIYELTKSMQEQDESESK